MFIKQKDDKSLFMYPNEDAQACFNLIENIQEILQGYFTEEAPFEDFIQEIESYANCQILNALRKEKLDLKRKSYLIDEKASLDHVSKRLYLSNQTDVLVEEEGEAATTSSSDITQADDKSRKIDLPERKFIKFLRSPKERLDAILTLEAKVPTVEGLSIKCYLPKVVIKVDMTLGAYDFVRQCLRPVRMCLDNHFDGNKDSFLEFWAGKEKAFSFTNFVSKCKGEDDCNPHVKDQS